MYKHKVFNTLYSDSDSDTVYIGDIMLFMPAQAKIPESIIGWKSQGKMNHKAVESRSVHKVNDCNKEVTSQTILAAPVTDCLFYFISLFTHSFMNTLE